MSEYIEYICIKGFSMHMSGAKSNTEATFKKGEKYNIKNIGSISNANIYYVKELDSHFGNIGKYFKKISEIRDNKLKSILEKPKKESI